MPDDGDKHYRQAYQRLKEKYRELQELTDILREANKKLVNEHHVYQKERMKYEMAAKFVDSHNWDVQHFQENVIRRLEHGLLTIHDKSGEENIRQFAVEVVKTSYH